MIYVFALLQTILSIGDMLLNETSNNEEVIITVHALILSFRILLCYMHSTHTHTLLCTPYTAQYHRWQHSDCYHRETSFQWIHYIN